MGLHSVTGMFGGYWAPQDLQISDRLLNTNNWIGYKFQDSVATIPLGESY